MPLIGQAPGKIDRVEYPPGADDPAVFFIARLTARDREMLENIEHGRMVISGSVEQDVGSYHIEAVRRALKNWDRVVYGVDHPAIEGSSGQIKPGDEIPFRMDGKVASYKSLDELDGECLSWLAAEIRSRNWISDAEKKARALQLESALTPSRSTAGTAKSDGATEMERSSDPAPGSSRTASRESSRAARKAKPRRARAGK